MLMWRAQQQASPGRRRAVLIVMVVSELSLQQLRMTEAFGSWPKHEALRVMPVIRFP